MLPVHIDVQLIPHNHQRYDTAGDYYERFGAWQVRISDTPDWRHAALVMIHELVEMVLTKQDKISWLDIDTFDRYGAGKDSDDPGSLENAPYHSQHVRAECIERQVAAWLGVDWGEYNTALDSLIYKEK